MPNEKQEIIFLLIKNGLVRDATIFDPAEHLACPYETHIRSCYRRAIRISPRDPLHEKWLVAQTILCGKHDVSHYSRLIHRMELLMKIQ